MDRQLTQLIVSLPDKFENRKVSLRIIERPKEAHRSIILPVNVCPHTRTIVLLDKVIKFDLEQFTQTISEQREDFVFKHFELSNKEICQRHGDFGLKFLFTQTCSLRLVNQDFQNEVTLPAGCCLTDFEAIETMFPMPLFTTHKSPMRL